MIASNRGQYRTHGRTASYCPTLFATGRRALCRCNSGERYSTTHGAPSRRLASPPLRRAPRGFREAGMVRLMSWSSTTRFVKARRLSALAGGLLVCALASAPSAFASTPTVNLGQAAGYAVISGVSVANLGLSTVRVPTGGRRLGPPRPPPRLPAGRARRKYAGRPRRRDGVQRHARRIRRSTGTYGRRRASGPARRDAHP